MSNPAVRHIIAVMNLDLQSTEQIFKSVIDNLPCATGLFDSDLKYVYYNAAGEKMSGVPLADAQGKTPFDILPPELCEKFVPLLKKVLKEKISVSERVEFNFIGNDIILQVEYIPIFSGDGEVEFIMGITEDWTELENQRSEAMASARLASLGHMAANITHEINNPIQLIQLRLFRLEEMISSNPEDTESMQAELKDIFRTTERVNKIVESVRRQSKRHAHEEMAKVYVSQLVEEAITYSRNHIDFSKAELILDFNKDALVLCNAIEVEQVIINLITNACDAIVQSPAPWIKITSSIDNDGVSIYVQDSGNGIDEETQKNLMKPFFTTKSFKKGTGLGLNLSKTLIKRNNGQLNYLPSKPNTTFQVKLQKA